MDGITYHKELEGLMASNYWLSAVTLSKELRVKNWLTRSLSRLRLAGLPV